MQPDPRFTKQPKHFWANVRSISQQAGYTQRGTGQIKVHSYQEMVRALGAISLTSHHIWDAANRRPTEFGETLRDYFAYRAKVLNEIVEPNLMTAESAKEAYEELRKKYPQAICPVPMNKQKGDKRAPAYLTAMVNTIVAAHAEGIPCDYDPMALTTVTLNGVPLRTLSRRVDGAFPTSVNPIAIWEIKEYYYTTTFGSRVADGVYETLLDGMELEELREHEGINVYHYLVVDAHYTWWTCGRSYLCRIIDMMHMGYVDEVIFGKEVVQRLPELVKTWVADHGLKAKP
jgi:hypothetical protein